VVIRFGGHIQCRHPPAKHWVPFVLGCVPIHSDPGHDKGRLANRDVVRRGLARRPFHHCAGPSEVAFLFLARRSAGPALHFFIPVARGIAPLSLDWATLNTAREGTPR